MQFNANIIHCPQSMYGAKVFSIFKVCSGFWLVKIDDPSSYLTTFNMPFGCYRWKLLPFGICSAPEVFQKRMHKLIEGLTGVEVIADDFIIIGFGNTLADAQRSHSHNLLTFMKRCKERFVNIEKMKLRVREVPFIGHIATDKGLCVDPRKVRAITEMPQMTDVTGIQCLLSMTQYLGKFLPHLSDMTKPLSDMTQKDAKFL